jgi:hypothetical protein
MRELIALKDFKFGGIMIRRDMAIHMSSENARFYTAVGAVGPRDADGSGKIIVSRPYDPRVETVEQFEQRKAASPKGKATRKRATKRKAK